MLSSLWVVAYWEKAMAFEIVMSLLRRYAMVNSRTASESQRRGTAGGFNQEPQASPRVASVWLPMIQYPRICSEFGF